MEKAVKKNSESNYEPLMTLKLDALFKERFPIAYNAKLEELIEEEGMEEEEAIAAMKTMEVELELYYDKGKGFFAIDSEAVVCSPIYSPYTSVRMEEPDD